MGQRDLSRRELAALAGVAALAASSGGAEGAPALSDPRDEFIRVARDRWTFETDRSRRRFVPFGANLVLTDKADLDCFGPRYASDRYRHILEASARQGVNTLKVFLPIGSLLPDPQQAGEARPAPGYFENLDDFLGLCRTHGIRAVICLSEWGVHGCRWWQEGGQYFGRRPWRTDPGVDSIGILCEFWRVLATRLRRNPQVFSYTLCAEWSMPSGNMTPPWAPPDAEVGLVQGPVALWHWRHWLLAKYGSMDRLNKAWGTQHSTPEDVSIVDYTWDGAAKRYRDPVAKVLDYQNFREWVTMRYFRPQIAAIRSVDANHMVTISNHMRSWNLWEGAAKHFLGYTPAEEAAHIDYMTLHANYAEGEISNNRTPEQVVREIEVLARFSSAGRRMPLFLEEFTYATPDPVRTACAQEALVRGTLGHVSAWTSWYLQFPDGAGGAATADTPHRMAWLNADLTPTPWGEAARALASELRAADLRRKVPRRVVRLDRAVELTPTKLGVLASAYLQYKPEEHPMDYTVRHEPDLDLRLEGDVARGPAPLRCRPVISGNLRPYDPSITSRLGRAGWEREISDERAIGFDLLWLSHIAPAWSGSSGDPVRDILDICAERKTQVILDIGSSPDWYGVLDARAERKLVGETIRQIARRYGGHPAFHAWYIPHEIYQAWDRMGAYMDELYPALVADCKKAAPGKPVTLSPFFILDRDQIFGAFRTSEPEEYGDYWAGLIRRSGFDIIMLQDSGEHFSYVTNDQRRPFFEAMQRACRTGGARLWGNVETAEFECPGIEEYVKRYGRVHHSTVANAPWRAVPVPRLQSKLRLAAEYCERLVAWGYCQFGRPTLGPTAAAWHREYQRYVQDQRG
jgi:hypothetical protein